MKARTLDDFEDQIDEWHNSGEEEKRKLHEFLGLTWEEYTDLIVRGEPGKLWRRSRPADFGCYKLF